LTNLSKRTGIGVINDVIDRNLVIIFDFYKQSFTFFFCKNSIRFFFLLILNRILISNIKKFYKALISTNLSLFRHSMSFIEKVFNNCDLINIE